MRKDMTLNQVIEALIFASPKPLLTKEIVAALRSAGADGENLDAAAYGKSNAEAVESALAELQTAYAEGGRAFQLAEQVNGWALVTDPAAAPWVRQLYPEAKPARLSGPALETLAIIAYRQPITRADIEAVRGVAVDGVMQVLLERGLVKISGRAEMPGRPLLYATTEYFLQHFGLKGLADLPNSDELRRIQLPSAPAEAAASKETDPAASIEEPAQNGPSTEAAREEPPHAEATPAASDANPAG